MVHNSNYDLLKSKQSDIGNLITYDNKTMDWILNVLLQKIGLVVPVHTISIRHLGAPLSASLPQVLSADRGNEWNPRYLCFIAILGKEPKFTIKWKLQREALCFRSTYERASLILSGAFIVLVG